MITRSAMAVSGAVGILLAALIYFLASRLSGAFGPFVPMREAEVVVFTILFVVSLLEMPMMVFGLRQLRRAKINSLLVCSVNSFYVAFAAVYASVQVLLFGGSNLAALLAGLSLVRWISTSWML